MVNCRVNPSKTRTIFFTLRKLCFPRRLRVGSGVDIKRFDQINYFSVILDKRLRTLKTNRTICCSVYPIFVDCKSYLNVNNKLVIYKWFIRSSLYRYIQIQFGFSVLNTSFNRQHLVRNRYFRYILGILSYR